MVLATGSCGPTPVLGVHGIITYARFSLLKKPDFNPVPIIHGSTSWFDPGLKTLILNKFHLGFDAKIFIYFGVWVWRFNKCRGTLLVWGTELQYRKLKLIFFICYQQSYLYIFIHALVNLCLLVCLVAKKKDEKNKDFYCLFILFICTFFLIVCNFLLSFL